MSNNSLQEIVLAAPRGFCAGVDRAIDIVDRALEKFGAPVYVRHEIVHNTFVVADLKNRGAIFIEDLADVPAGATLVFSAHGVPKAVEEEAARRGFHVFDATCPLVTKVHVEVAKLHKEGFEFIMIGHKGHPEVEGTMGQLLDGIYLVEDVADVAKVQPKQTERLAVVTQASNKSVTAVLASGEAVRIEGKGLRQAQPGLDKKAKANLKLERGSVIRVLQSGKDWAITQWPQAEGALVAMDPRNGDIRALVGGFDFQRNQFNHVTQGWRQPGSSYKPFLYAAAIENGAMPQTLVNDAPLTDVGDWNPGNSDGSADGPITIRQALAKSKNLVTIRLVQLVGVEAARQWSGKYGFDVSKQPDNLTLALGAGSTTPMQLAGAYSVIANGGLRVKPVIIKSIQDGEGKKVFEAPAQILTEEQRVISPRNAFMTASLLQEVTRSGTAARAQGTLKRPDIYGKTGTTNDVVDAWFAGFQTNLVAVVWIGHDTPKSLGSHASGGSLALPAWIQFMGSALRGAPVAEIQPPEGVVYVENDWRYIEWMDGGFIDSLGLDGQSVSPAMIPSVPVFDPSAPADGASAAAEGASGVEHNPMFQP
mgnify:CR=1 FL=1